MFRFMKTKFEHFLKDLFLFIFLLTSLSGHSQVSFNSCGGEITQQGVGFVSYSVGQLDYLSLSSSDAIVSAGVQQPYACIGESTIVLPDSKIPSLVFSVTPNPTKDNVVVSFFLEGEYQYVLTDVNGKLFEEGWLTNGMILSLQDYLSGTYLLQVISAKDNKISMLKKIIKE